VSSAAINLCVASQQVFLVVGVYFVIDSVRKLLDTPLYVRKPGVPIAADNSAGSRSHVTESVNFR
jgi:hypothetical protein